MNKLTDAELEGMRGHTPGPLYWSEDRFRGGYSGLFDSNDQPVLYPQCANDGDSGAAWFNTDGDAGEQTLTEANAELFKNAPALLAEVIERRARDAKVNHEAAMRAWSTYKEILPGQGSECAERVAMLGAIEAYLAALQERR